MKKKTTKLLLGVLLIALLFGMTAISAFAAGDVSATVEKTWGDM